MTAELFCATGNPGKLREFQLAAGEDFKISALEPLPCPEDGRTFEENAAAKALCYSRAALSKSGARKSPPPLVFADDSGLEVDALNGAPGVRSSRFAGPEADDGANNALLLEKLAGVPPPRRTARFVCVIALTRGSELLGTFRGDVEGSILEAPAGSGGFGYDPLFLIPELGQSFAELAPGVKLAHSHRGRAFRQLLEWLRLEENRNRKL